MRRSTTLPQFQPSPEKALDAALAAERQGLDGVFVYDHLFPLGRPAGHPAAECITLLSALAIATTRLRIGTLVLRVGLRPAAVVLASLRTVASMAPGRLVVGLGTGDRLSREENVRFGISYGSVDERLDEVGALAQALSAEGIEVWIGGHGRRIRTLCADLGLTWNVWGTSDAEMARMLDEVPQARVTWGGDTDPPQFSMPVDEVVSTAARMIQ